MCAKDYRTQAWSQLSGNWGIMVLASLIYAILISALSTTAIGAIVLLGPLTVGYVTVTLMLARGEKPRLEAMFEGIGTHFVDRMLALLLTSIYTFLWSLLFIIPGIIKAYSYSMVPYILRDHPEMTATEAINRSREIMNGRKWNLFCLQFSFIGWILLCGLTFGILTLWVYPYMQQAEANFYESIKGEPTPATFTDHSDHTDGTQAL